jgi:glycosyltransferase involved in cell wall biosynthesis
MRALDVFVDFSSSTDAVASEAMARLESPDSLGGIASRIFCAAPQVGFIDANESRRGVWRILDLGPVEACACAMAAAADSGHPLLVLMGGIEPGCDAIGTLLGAFDDDPMIGFSSPRLTGGDPDSIAALDEGGDPALPEMPRRLLAELPPSYLVADARSRCLLIKRDIVANFGRLDSRFTSLAGALRHYVGSARRCGFRTVVCNQAVAIDTSPDGQNASGATIHRLPRRDQRLLRELLPDVERTDVEFGTRPIASIETRLARALPRAYGARPSLLLDVRNCGRHTNGTAIAALGIARGVQAIGADWDVALLARREASLAHGLEELFPEWPIYTSVPDRQFTVALRLSQPWHIEELIELHDLAAYNLYLFLDTISWDIAYPAPRHLDGTWRFLADQADGLVFISEFTRDRFLRRFAEAAAVPQVVSYLSFEPADYIHPDVQRAHDPQGPIFVVGNGYDHKDMSRTSELLTTAFPFEAIVALGPVPAPTPRVTVFESGSLSELELHHLYAGSRAVVFPSFYEGFGLPIVTTLAYGGTLLARRSTLLSEIAGECRPHQGRIVPFDRREDMVELVGRILHHETVPELPLGGALAGERPKSWRDVAATITTFAGELTSDLSRSRWRSRDHSIRQLLAARADVAPVGAAR